MQKVKCKKWNAKSEVQKVKCKKRNGKSEMQKSEMEKWNAKSGMKTFNSIMNIIYFENEMLL